MCVNGCREGAGNVSHIVDVQQVDEGSASAEVVCEDIVD